MKQVNYKINVTTDGAQKNVKGLNQDLSSTDKEVKSVNKSGKGLGDTFSKLGISMKSLATGAVVAGVGAIVGVFTSAIKKGAEFAKQMSTLEAVSGATQEEMTALSNSAKELGASTQFTAVQVGELQTEFAKMGFTTKQILASTKATLDLAASMEVDLASAATLAGSTVNAFGLQAEDTQRVVDVLAKSTSSSALDFGSLTESLKVAAPIAKATGREIEEVTAMLGVLANTGLKGSVAGTGLSKTFIELNKKGIELKDALDTVSKSSDGLNTAIDLVGVVGAKSLLNLASKSEDIDRLTESFKHSAGAAAEMAEVRLDNLSGDTTKLGSAWEGFLLSIEDGEGRFNGIMRSIVQATTSLLNFITPTQDLTKALKDEKTELMLLEAQIFSANVPQEERVELITELKDKYPELLENIKAETVSNTELKSALQLVNKELVNKIILQEKQDEINEQAEESAAKMQKLLKEEEDLRSSIAFWFEHRERKGLSKFDFDDDLTYIENVRAFGEFLDDEGFNPHFERNITAINRAQRNLDEELEKGNNLLNEKNDLYERLGVSIEETTEDTKEEIVVKDNLAESNIGLIATQKDQLEQAKKLPETTERELIVKNRKIATINKEIKRLKALGVETKKVNKDKEKEAKKELERIKKEAKEKAKLERERIKNIAKLEGELLAEVEKLDELARQRKQTDQQNEIDAVNEKYFKLINDTRLGEEEILRLKIQLKEEEAIINEKFRKKEEEANRKARFDDLNERLDLASQAANSVQAIGDAVFAHKMKNLEKGSAEEEAMAKKQFKFNKALQLGMAIIDSGKAITASLAQSPIAIGPVPNPAGIASLAFAAATSAANIATIAAQQFQGGASTSPSSVSGAGAIGSQAPDFNVVGQSGFNQVAAALGEQNNTPIQAYVVSGNVTTAQALENNIIETATF
jgi:hypothetical protein